MGRPRFRPTAAVRPVPGRGVDLEEGYRLEVYHDPRAGRRVPTLAAAVSEEGILDLFLALLAPLGSVVDVVLMRGPGLTGRWRCREGIDLPVLQSHCVTFADLLLDDGCTGMVVLSVTEPVEVRLDTHKVLTVHAGDLRPFENLCQAHDVHWQSGLRLVQEGEHVHHTGPDHRRAFDRLARLLGADRGHFGDFCARG